MSFLEVKPTQKPPLLSYIPAKQNNLLLKFFLLYPIA